MLHSLINNKILKVISVMLIIVIQSCTSPIEVENQKTTLIKNGDFESILIVNNNKVLDYWLTGDIHNGYYPPNINYAINNYSLILFGTIEIYSRFINVEKSAEYKIEYYVLNNNMNDTAFNIQSFEDDIYVEDLLLDYLHTEKTVKNGWQYISKRFTANTNTIMIMLSSPDTLYIDNVTLTKL